MFLIKNKNRRMKKSLNKIEYLEELKQQVAHNLFCYSEDALMSKPKKQYIEEWNKELERLEIINEIIEEERNNNFHLYTSMYNLRNNRDERGNRDLAYLENREKGISCYLSIDGFDEKGDPEYMLVLSLHQIDAFDDEYENIYTRDISSNAFENKEKLKEEMQYALDVFEKFIQLDKTTNRFYSKYYENEETEEFE